jgi:hypothetical protein
MPDLYNWWFSNYTTSNQEIFKPNENNKQISMEKIYWF